MVELVVVLGPGADAVDTLARLQLAARRCGAEVRLRAPEPALLAVLELLGLGDVLPLADGPPGGPPGGQREGSANGVSADGWWKA